MFERVLIVAGLSLTLAVAWVAARAYIRQAGRRLPSLAADLAGPTPTVIYFSARACSQCRWQKAALGELDRKHGGAFRVRLADAPAEPELASRFGIMTVPSTVVVAPAGQILAVNAGYADAARLATQLGLA